MQAGGVPAAMNDAKRPFVFVVDDDEGVRASLKIALEPYCMGVEVFGSVEEFLLGYSPQARSCLVLDHHLHNTTGLEFLRSAEYRRLNLPVILVTGASNKHVRDEAFIAGVTGFLEKPWRMPELLAMVYAASAS